MEFKNGEKNGSRKRHAVNFLTQRIRKDVSAPSSEEGGSKNYWVQSRTAEAQKFEFLCPVAKKHLGNFLIYKLSTFFSFLKQGRFFV